MFSTKKLGRHVYVHNTGAYRTPQLPVVESVVRPSEAPARRAQGDVQQAAPVPELAAHSSPAIVSTSEGKVEVLMSMRHPRIILFGGLLSPTECDELIALSAHKLERSRTVNRDTGDSDIHVDRVSEGTYFHVAENALVARIDRRIAELLAWPVENGEGLQIIRYLPGGEYKPHYDYFDANHSGSAAHVERGGNRVATIIIYLATTPKGGATIFPEIGLEVAPTKGNAVFFSYAAPGPESLTLHGGAPVIEGEKWIATKWLRERAYR